MTPLVGLTLLAGAIVAIAVVNTWAINRRRDRARSARALERRRGGVL